MFDFRSLSGFTRFFTNLPTYDDGTSFLRSRFVSLQHMLPKGGTRWPFIQSIARRLQGATECKRECERNWRLLAETMPQLVWTAQPDGYVDYVNQRYCDLTQANSKQLKGFGWHQFIHPDDYANTLALRERSLATGELYESEYRIKDGRTGTYHWFLARAYPMRDHTGRIVQWFGTGTDVDEMKRVQQALLESQRRLHALMASNIIGIFTARNEVVIEANDAFLHMTGYSQEDVQQGRVNWFQMTAPEYIGQTQQAHQRLDQYHYLPVYEKEYLCKDGSSLPVLVGGVITNPDTYEMLCFVLDNTVRKQLEQRKDDFLNIASHELRTPLTAVKLQTQHIQRRLKKQGHTQVANEVHKVEEPLHQLERMIRELLDVSQLQKGKLQYLHEPVDLNTLLHNAVTMTERIYPTHRIVLTCSDALTIMGDRGRLEQALMNLLSNAIKYSPEASRVEVAVTASDETITISVHDYGLGIPEGQYEHIFERFYRIDHQRQGSIAGLGIGLSIVDEVVKHHGGTVSVESVIGEGSTFHVTLPRPIADPSLAYLPAQAV